MSTQPIRPTDALRRRNRLTACALCLAAGTFVFFKNQAGIQWFMWRDAPALAAAVALIAVACAVFAWRGTRA